MSLTTCYDNKWKKKKKTRKEFGATEAEASDIEEWDKINVLRLCATAAELLYSVTSSQKYSDMLQLQRSNNKTNSQLQTSKVVKGLEAPVYEIHKGLDTSNLPKLASTC